jgi:DNA-binding CsgD family transcriptional regulator
MHELKVKPGQARGLECLAGLAAAHGQALGAARLFGAAEALRDAMAAPLPEVEHPDYDRDMQAARGALSAAAFAAAWAQGRALPLERAVAEALAIGVVDGPSAPATLTASMPGPAGLTPREVEVLRCIAAGRSNREIATDLSIAERTVARHITNIYDKIGARSKAEATAYAFRHGLEQAEASTR